MGDPFLDHVAKLDPRVGSLARNPFSDLPRFVYEFKSESNPVLNGSIEVRYPTMGDMLAIESLTQRSSPFSEVVATLQVLIEKAPACWYHLAAGERTPILALSRMPYDTEIFKIYGRFTNWRDSFRSGDQSSPGGAPE